MTRVRMAAALLPCLFAAAVYGADAQVNRAPIDFNHTIRPILSNNCFTCHGPDSHQRKADLRLDQSDDAYAKHRSGMPIVRGDVAASQVAKRIVSTDADERMPPPDSGKKLSPQQIELLRDWIAQGGKYEKHWAFIAPRRPALPAVNNASWCVNPIDRFVLARLESEGLTPSPAADRVTLCRRVYLDLIGLPPTPAQVDAFVGDRAPDAYEKLVDRLLANPHYGERMALDWLDAGRFADTHGYHIDSGRNQTLWRDWVIKAFNDNKPFDQFTIEQLAGDLLPNATNDQKIATAFVRNNMVNFEGGAIPEEYLTAYIMDRVSTTSTVFLGLTLQCAQCHDHKFDPLSQKNYYQMYAFFNAVPERGLDGAHGNAGPLLATPTSAQQHQLDEIAQKSASLEQQISALRAEADAAQRRWEEQSAPVASAAQWSTLNPAQATSQARATLKIDRDGSVRASGKNPDSDAYTIVLPTTLSKVTAIRLEALPEPKLKAGGPGRSDNGNMVLTHISLKAGVGSDPAAARELKFNSASADFSQERFPVDSIIKTHATAGWAIYPRVGEPHQAVFVLDRPVENTGSLTLTLTLEFNSDYPRHQLGYFRIAATDAADPRAVDPTPEPIAKIRDISPEKRTPSQATELQAYFRRNIFAPTRALMEAMAKLALQKSAIEEKVPTTMVMSEMAKPRDTFILQRGQYDKPGEHVTADVPEQIAPWPAGAPHNRLGLAQWLVSPEQPLTSRVIVNRYWQGFFGTGIVKTAEDFGSQGEEPTHEQLLDWMAVQFQRGDETTTPWNLKAMLKMIVMSSTYRQLSAASPELIARDPENRLLARGPRMRLHAELIRDEALAISGLLNDEIGGQSVSPYQPPGLWDELMSRDDGDRFTAQKYKQDHGKNLYRRTMYTFWKRSCPPPSLATFDAPDRETCVVRRARTNTPLQALVLMNDPTYVESARKLAERILIDGGADDDSKIVLAFRLATSRAPRPEEIAVLRRIHDRERAVFAKDAAAAEQLLSVGESPRNTKLDAADLAAWSTVCSVILNLDETITKG